ncbi:uncharacterized protein LOC118437473 [Folsomia candida]|uniref:uncharacterized protein LOC118437473 n=1 Tax=Folsomia candida TaxID=158441 RepID=UPI0016054171|nr:uncharacterized protein LOC118437473 [Folsomia candida]
MANTSIKAVNSYLDLFTLNASDVSTLNSYHVPVFPTVSTKEIAAPLEFNVSGVPGVDLSCTNNLLHSLFDMVEVYMNGKLISSKPFYHYCAYLLNHLSYSEVYKKEILKNALYIRDTNADEQSDDNDGYASRKSYLAKSQSVELCGRIMDDVCLQPRWILPLVDFKLKLRRAPVRFSLASAVDTTEYIISIDEAVFYIKNQLVSPKVVELHEKILDKQKALYPLVRNEIKTVSVAKGSKIPVTENIFSTVQLRQRIVIGLVETDSISGKYSKNPFNFANFNLSRFVVSINNVPLEYRSLNLTFSTRYLLAYQSFIDGLSLENKTIGIDRSSFADGNTLFAFQLQSFQSETSFYPTNGTFKLELDFSQELSAAVTVIILSQTQNLLTINKYREVEIENQGLLR